VKHIRLQTDDIPAAPFLMDRRRTPERRTIWRGGRRDSDWRNRPLGAWNRVHDAESESSWKRVLASLHLW
jgi:hypothetical protein